MILRLYSGTTNFYRLKISAPDGRFQGDDLVGGIDKKTMEREAKKYSDMGMLVQVFSSRR